MATAGNYGYDTPDGFDEAQNMTGVTRALSGTTRAVSQTKTYNGDGLLQTTTS